MPGLDFTMRPIIHFEIILMIYLRKGLRFIIFHMDIQLFQHNLLKNYYFPMNWLGKFVENQLTIDWVFVHLFMYSFFCSIISMLSLYWFHIVYIALVLKCVLRSRNISFQFFFQNYSDYSRLFAFPILESASQLLYKKSCWDCDCDYG